MSNSTKSTMYIPTYEDVIVAHERIKPYIHKTPVLTSTRLNAKTCKKRRLLKYVALVMLFLV